MYRSISTIVLLTFALGAVAGDPDAARSILVQHCVKCHAVPDYNPEGGPPSVNAPPFTELASDRERYSDGRLRAFLRSPHWPMTQFNLSPSDIENLLSYIETLRNK